MFRKHLILKLIVVALVVVLGAYVVAYAAGDASDPLISLSYINETVIPAIEQKLGGLIGAAKDDLSDSFDSTLDQFKSSINANTVANVLDGGDNGYKSIELKEGGKISLTTGCEFLFVSGGAACQGTVSDTTAGASVTDGALEANHLYLCPGDAAITASGDCQVLVKGEHTVG